MKNLINITLALLFAANLNAQNPNGWIEEGAEFYHVLYGSGDHGYARYYLDEEFEVNGLMLQRLKVEVQTRTQIGPDEFILNDLIQLSWSRLFHTSNDTVYFANENGELRFAWHLNPAIGDVWNFGEYPLSSEENEMNVYGYVVNVQEVQIGGLSSKDITFVTCLDSIGSPVPHFPTQTESYLRIFYEGKINTVFGPHKNFHYAEFCEIHPQTIFCPSTYSSLACYKSASFDLTHLLQSQSCTGSILSIEFNNMLDFTLYPNPTSTTFSLTHPEHIQSIQIYDIQGRLQLRSKSLPVDVRSMKSGVYWVQIETLDGQVKIEKLVVE